MARALAALELFSVPSADERLKRSVSASISRREITVRMAVASAS